MIVREIVADALRKIGVVAIDDEAAAEEMAYGARALDRMLNAWQNEGHSLWAVAEQTVPMNGAGLYALPQRAVRVHHVSRQTDGRSVPLQRLMREEWDNLPNRGAVGVPTSYYVDQQRTATILWVWPVSATGHLRVTYDRAVEDMTKPAAQVDVPPEWEEAVVYGLASRLADDFQRQVPTVIARAEAELTTALAADHEGSVYFGEREGYWL